MSTLGARLKEAWEWTLKDKQTLLVGELSLGAVLVVLLILMQVPGWVVASSLENAEAQINQAYTLISDAQSRYDSEAGWYDDSYTDDIPVWLAEANMLLSEDGVRGAEVLLTQARDGNYDDARQLAGDATSLAKEAQLVVQQVFVKLDENQALRDRAFSALQGLKRDKSSAGTLLAAAQSRYDREHVDHTLKYTSELETKLQQADSRFSSASDYLAAATANLPDVNINDHLGDPLLALDNIEQAVVEITEQNTLTAYVTSRLDYLAEAKANAASRTAQAEIEIEVSDSHLWNLVVTRDYDPDRALQQAYGLLDSAVFSYDKAVEKLENPVFGDGKIDYPVAYEAAKASIASSNAAIASANQVVAADDASLAKLAQYDSRRASAQSAISNAQSAENTLRSNHASSAWSGVSSNISNAQSKLSTAASLRQDAINARTSQDFLLADSKAQQALNELGNIESLCNSVVSRKSTLENVRLHDWPNAKSDAESAIRSARSQISASHTDASVYSANSLIEDAESAARQERYEDAVRLARDAESEADSERREAISDEQAYQRQLEADAQATRDKAEANAQATRQKENANAQATRDAESINSSPPIDSGSGSDSGSSGSNNSSGGSSNSGGSSGDSGSIGGSNGDNCAFGCP